VVDIAAGGAASFVFAFTPSAAFEPGGDLPIEFFCANRLSAPITSGLNTLYFTASDAGGPDMVALAETGSAVGLNTDPGVIDIIDRGSAGAFVVATANVGSAGEVTVRAEPSDPDLPVTVRLCETDPATGACLAPRASEVTFTAEAGGSNSFALAAFGSDFVAFDPAGARVNVIFEQAGSRRGSTSVAVRTLLTEPVLPETPYAYNDALPAHFTGPVQGFGNLANQDNTPAGNPVTDAGATLGRVLFFDRRLSADNSVSCGSCHTAATGFSDPDRLSSGFDGGLTGRHSPGLSNARYYERGHFFWDERADTLEDQVLMPIQDAVEMGLTLNQAVAKLEAAGFYGPLFEDAFGDDAITSERMAPAMAQFVRAMVSYRSRFDEAFAGGGAPDFQSVFTEEEWLGAQLFGRIPGASVDSVGCDRCHIGVAQVADEPRNIGLDLVDADEGAGDGTFKPPSLRNISERGPYMHDGRFDTLAQVVEHYNSGVQANPNVDGRLTGPGGNPIRLNLTDEEKDALVAFMLTLTDETFLNDERFSDPFQR
jgi:cytochrome c peroxidase